MNKIFLTGATGFLGSHIMAALLRRGENVIVAGRASGADSPESRINRLLDWFGAGDVKGNLEVYETDFALPHLGLAPDVYARLCRETSVIIHCASDTSFAEKNRDRVMKSNVDNLAMILEFAACSELSYFHYISTAYASGTDSTDIGESPVKSAGFTNVYEESKAQAEILVASFCGRNSVPYTISRPSIVYGDSVTGRSLRFNALYYPVKAISYIRDIYHDDIKLHGGTKSAEAGVSLGADGIMHLPIRIYLPYDGLINLIPVDYFVSAFASIMDNPSPSMIYHLTSGIPSSMAELALYTGRFLAISGIEVICGADTSKEMRNPAEEIFDHFIEAYRPYLSDRRTFSRNNTDRVTNNRPAPALTYEVFERCMAYAVQTDWGKKIF